MSPGASRTTKSHKVIRKWVEERGGQPATVRGAARSHEAGVLRIDFPGGRGKETLKPIPWEEFFEKFDAKNLVFLYEDTTENGKPSRFCKFVGRENTRIEEKPRGRENGNTKSKR